MKKKVLSGLLAIAMVFGSAAALPEGVFEISTTITASAEVNTATSGTCGENLTWTLNDGLLTISGTGRMTNYKYNESPFLNRTDIQTITIKNGVENIGNYAFKGCTNLVSITMPNSVGTIGHYALMECKKLMELTIPSNVTYIGEYAFESCITLTSVVIPDKVMHIGDCAFRGCINLVDITIPSKASIIGGNAFAATKWLEKKREENPLVVVNDILIDAQTYEGILNIPDTIIDIAANAFYTNEKLTGVTIPSSIEEIRDSAFKGCKGLTSITIPDSVRWIDDNAFRNCENLQTITLSSNLEQIGKYCFAYCTKLTKVIVPDSVTYIGDGAFSYCKNLTSVTLSNSIINIDYLTFNGCSNLKSVTIPENVTKIEDGAFEDCTNLTSVNVPSSVKTIGKDSFDKECTIICEKGSAAETYAKGNGNEIIYSEPDYLYKELDDGTVQIIEYTGKIAELTIPSKLPKAQKKVTSIGPSAFFTNTRLKSVTIPNGVTSIDTYAFCNCSNLTSVNIPNSVTSIGVSAFGNCPSLTSITIPSGVTSIASCTFSLCTSLKSITIPSNVTNIDSSAFSDCTSLKSVTIPSSVTSIGSVAFGYTSGGKVDDFTIKALKGTAAETYAKDNGFKIEYIGLKHIAAKAATCTAYGNIEYWKHDGKFYSDAKLTTEITQAKTVVKATGHKYGEPTWTWTGTTAATAKFVCANNKSHVQTVKATVKSTTTKPTCTKAGKTVYTATVKFGDKTYTNSKTVTLKALGHKMGDWKTTSFNVDKKTATQTRKCARGDKTETQTVKNAIVRYAGSDRAQTASLISSGMYKTADTVIIATGFDFHDALAAVPLASAYNAPLLLADRDNLSDKTIAEIKRLKAKNVIVVASTNAKDQNGNDAAIKSNVYNQLKELKVKVTKLDGKTYYATAKKVADQLKTKSKKAPTSVFITTDKNYADALSASPVAAILGAPILYVDPKASLNATTKNYLASIKKSVKDVYIVGGVNAVSTNVEKAILNTLGKKSATRFAGDNRYDTCVKINKAFAKTLTGKSVCIAKGYNFPDALAGGVFAAKNKAPLFLADKLDAKATLNNVQSSYLKSKNPGKLYIFGGETAVPTQLVKTIAKSCV